MSEKPVIGKVEQLTTEKAKPAWEASVDPSLIRDKNTTVEFDGADQYIEIKDPYVDLLESILAELRTANRLRAIDILRLPGTYNSNDHDWLEAVARGEDA